MYKDERKQWYLLGQGIGTLSFSYPLCTDIQCKTITEGTTPYIAYESLYNM